MNVIDRAVNRDAADQIAIVPAATLPESMPHFSVRLPIAWHALIPRQLGSKFSEGVAVRGCVPASLTQGTELKTKEANRTGLRIYGSRGRPEVRAALVRFAKWLHANYEFPIRVPVYLSPLDRIRTIHGESAAASFFAPFDRSVEPYIRIATGDFPILQDEDGWDGALAAFLISLAHEVIHYQQWVSTGRMSERGVDQEAARIVDRYASTVDHP